jgi:fumarate reductase subunit D
MAGLFIPAFIVATGFLLPFAAGGASPQDRYEQIHGTVAFWPVRIVVFGVLLLAFVHCGHRMRHILMDLGLRHAQALLGILCYGGALLGSAAAGWFLVTL